MVPKVSVVMPNYNGEKYLKESIESVLNQTYNDFEFLIIDDASTDSSKDIIESFNDSRIVAYYSKKNRNVAYTANIGLKKARGRYIARIDSDDIWELDKLEKQIRFMDNNPQYGVCFTKIHLIDENTVIADKKYEELCSLFNSVENMTQKEWVQHFFYIGNCLCNPSSLIRKSVIDDIGYYNIAYVPAQDFELWTRVVIKYPIYVLDEKLIKYRWTENENKISGNSNGREFAFLNVYTLVRRNYFNYMTNKEFIKYFSDKFINTLSVSSEELDCEKAQILLGRFKEGINILGLEKYEQILRDSSNLDRLEENYGFSLSEYYREYRNPNYYCASLNKIEKLRIENKTIQQEKKKLMEETKLLIKDNRELIEERQNLVSRLNELNKKSELLQNIVEDLMNSTSWRLTKPMRILGSLIRRVKEGIN